VIVVLACQISHRPRHFRIARILRRQFAVSFGGLFALTRRAQQVGEDYLRILKPDSGGIGFFFGLGQGYVKNRTHQTIVLKIRLQVRIDLYRRSSKRRLAGFRGVGTLVDRRQVSVAPGEGAKMAASGRGHGAIWRWQ
jgi:hypothetical protein